MPNHPRKTNEQIRTQLACSIREACQLTTLSENFVRELVKTGRLKSISAARIPGKRGRRLITVSSLVEFIERGGQQ
jgi:hypothetical protein